MAKNKSTVTLNTSNSSTNLIALQIEQDVKKIEKENKKLEVSKNLVNFLQLTALVCLAFTPLTFGPFLLTVLALEAIEHAAIKAHKDRLADSSSLSIITDLIKDKKKSGSVFEQITDYTLRREHLESIVAHIVQSKTPEELTKLNIDASNYLAPHVRQHTFTTFLGSDFAEEIEEFERKNFAKIKKQIKTIDDTSLLFSVSQLDNLDLSQQITLIDKHSNMNPGFQHLPKAQENHDTAQKELWAQFISSVLSAKLNVVNNFTSHRFTQANIQSLVQNNYTFSKTELDSLTTLDTSQPSNLALLVSLAPILYQQHLENKPVLAALSICVDKSRTALSPSLLSDIQTNCFGINTNTDKNILSPQTNINLDPQHSTQSAPIESRVEILSKKHNPLEPQYKDMNFKFQSTLAQNNWSQLVENLNTIEVWLNTESSVDLSAESRADVKTIMNSTLPSTHQIYTQINALPKASRTVILTEVEATVQNMLDMTSDVIGREAQRQLKNAQTLREYSHTKKMSMSK